MVSYNFDNHLRHHRLSYEPFRFRCRGRRWPRPEGEFSDFWRALVLLLRAVSDHHSTAFPCHQRSSRIPVKTVTTITVCFSTKRVGEHIFKLFFFTKVTRSESPSSAENQRWIDDSAIRARGSDSTNEWMLAMRAAAMTSSIVTSRLLSPYWMFSRMLQSNRTGSCETSPIWERSHWIPNSWMSFPSTIYNRNSLSYTVNR